MTHPQPPEDLIEICAKVKQAQGRALLVGGCVRDALLGLDQSKQKDWDLEVYGVDEDTLISKLGELGKVNQVGRSFGVLKLNTGSGEDYDISLPRREIKTGEGHTGFEVTVDPSMSVAEAAKRRDFTINAIYYDPLTSEIVDPANGVAALEQRLLSPVSERFKEDPLRVLRGMQFAGRFDMQADERFCRMAKEVHNSFGELAGERVWGEFEKWASRSIAPSNGLEVLKETGWSKHFPEIHKLIGCPQDPIYHPEGDVFRHTGFCCDALSQEDSFREASPEKRAMLMITMLATTLGSLKPLNSPRKTDASDTQRMDTKLQALSL